MSEVYANILESLTSGLYNKVNYAVREYLQNSYDAIKEVRKHNLEEPPDGYHVAVHITKDCNIITISDNGIGMSENVLREYTSIGGGTKNDPELTGHKGIGKLSGLRFFKRFVVRTKAPGSKNGFKLDWDTGKMMEVLLKEKKKMKKVPYREFIKDFFSITLIESQDIDEHYTQVQLINVLEEFKKEVDEKEIGYFIKKNCPVPFYAEEFNYTDDITRFLDDNFSPVMTYINDKVIYQPYGDNDHLIQPKFKLIKYNDKLRAKVWFSWIRDTSEIIRDEMIGGIKFRCKGICVGDSNLFANNCMPPGREYLANWFTGEIILLDDDIRPNTARDGFYEGEESKKLYQEIKKSVGKELSAIADIRSEINTANQELIKLKKDKKEGIKNVSTIIKKIKERVKNLKRYRERETYNIDFGIIDKLELALNQEIKKEKDKLPRTENEVKSLIDEGDTEKLINKALELKDQEIKANFKDAIKAFKKNIDQIKTTLIEKDRSKEKRTVEVPLDERIQIILEIITKFLSMKNIEFDKREIEEFVKHELK